MKAITEKQEYHLAVMITLLIFIHQRYQRILRQKLNKEI